MESDKASRLTGNTAGQSLNEVEKDLDKHFQALDRMLYVTDPQKQNVPVAFASNILYVMERNGMRNMEQYERVLLPILKAKLKYLHAEGVAQTTWALSQAKIWDSDIWNELKQLI